mmetsp:Transcript_12705/g.40106  ORF Transcript_12705/g.40106 Transcript_12705/m.40106 type:complete len:403 (-) Transcript_12705:63-1271(-)
MASNPMGSNPIVAMSYFASPVHTPPPNWRGQAEHPDRVTTAMSALQAAGITTRCELLQCGREASDEELQRVHLRKHLDQVARNAAAQSKSKNSFFTEGTESAARVAAAAVIDATKHVLGDHGPRRSFVLARPPGHHASRTGVPDEGGEGDFAEGGCYYNSVAVAAAAAQQDGVDRIAIVDFDVHHGNGTQEIFESDPSVLVISLHADLRYPGTGAIEEVGEGAGAGFNVNIMWEGSADWPPHYADYAVAVKLVVLPILQAFRPGLLLISAGFDAAEGEGFHAKLAPESFGAMTESMLTALPDVPTVAALEGGYVPPMVARCCVAVMGALLGDKVDEPEETKISKLSESKGCKATLLKVAEAHEAHWGESANLTVAKVKAFFEGQREQQKGLPNVRGSKRGRA